MIHIPWHLLWQFTQRELHTRFRGSLLGLAWLWLTPLLTLLLFTLVFHGIFGMKWPGAQSQDAFSFGLFLFVGLSAYQLFAEVVNRSALLIVGQPNLVTKVVFPLWVLPSSLFGAAVGQYLASLLLLLAVIGWYQGPLWTWLWLPLVLLPFFMGIWGGALLFASLGVYVRDLGHVLGMATTAIMFLSPIFYPLSAVPESWRDWLLLNPLTLVIEPLRALLLLNQSPSLTALLALYALGLLSAAVGWWSFKRLSKGFADVI